MTRKLSGKQLISILVFAAIVLAGLRMVSLVSHLPMLGYANQYDMARTSACIGLWPVQERADAANPQAPIRHYVRGPNLADVCYPSTDALIAGFAKRMWMWAASANLAPAGEFDLRWVGATKLVLLMTATLLIAVLLAGQPWLGALHALSVLLVFADPLNTLYFNTLYTEFSAMFGAYVVFGALLLVTAGRSGRPLLIARGLMLCGLLALLFSRAQHVFLPVVLLIPFAIVEWRIRRSGATLAIGVMAACLLLVFGLRAYFMTEPSPGMGKANTVNAVFHAHLPVYPDTARALERLRLNPDCGQLLYTSWYRTRGHDFDATCPEVFSVSRVRLLTALLSEPKAALRLAAFAAYSSSGWRMGALGEVEGLEYARIDTGSVLMGGSASGAIDRMSFAQYLFFGCVPVFAGLLAGLVLILRRPGSDRAGSRSDTERAYLVALFVSALIVLYAWASSLLGDGTSELNRHLHLAQLFSLLSWLAIGVLVVHAIASRYPERRYGAVDEIERHWSTLWLPASCLVTALVAAVVVSRVQATIGTIDIVDRHVFVGNQALELSGWAKDPHGIDAVTLSFRDRRYVVRTLLPAPSVDQWFPIDSRHTAITFSATVDLGAANEEPLPLRLLVRNRLGREYLIDSIWLQID